MKTTINKHEPTQTREEVEVLHPHRAAMDSLDQVKTSPMYGERYVEYEFVEHADGRFTSKTLTTDQRNKLRAAGFMFMGAEQRVDGGHYLTYRKYYRSGK